MVGQGGGSSGGELRRELRLTGENKPRLKAQVNPDKP